MEQALAGLRVVEFAGVLAGPAVGLFLAELGAQVVKIENKATGGDMTRRWKLPQEDQQWDYSAYFCSVNWGKTLLLLDLDDPADRHHLQAYLAEADVIISNFKASAAQRWQLDYRQLAARWPRIIYVEISGYGSYELDRPAFDMVLQAEAGFLYMTGWPNQSPVKLPVALIDLLTAHQLKSGVLLALWQRDRTGVGGKLAVNLFQAAVASLANQATNWLVAGQIPQPMGTLHPNIAPYGEVFYAQDGLALVLAVGTDAQFQHLWEVLNLGAAQSWSTYATNALRLQHREALEKLLAQVIAQHPRAELLQLLLAAGVPAGAVRTMPEVFAHPASQELVQNWVLPDGKAVQSVRSTVFDWQPWSGGERPAD